MTVTLTDQEYQVLAAEAARRGEPPETLLRDLIQLLQLASTEKRPMTGRELAEKLYRERKLASLAIQRPLAYHWISYGCIQKYQQHRDKHQGLTAYLVGLGEQRLAQWWRNFEDLRQAGFYGNQTGESEVQEALDLLGRIRIWATT